MQNEYEADDIALVEEHPFAEPAAVVDAPPKMGGVTILTKKEKEKKKALAHVNVDPIVDVVHRIENLKKDEALKEVAELEERHNENYFQMGGVLSVIRNQKYFEPYGSFDEWREAETAMSHGKANALVQIYDAVANSGMNWDKVKGIGWTKLRAVASVLTPQTAEDWIRLASDRSKTEIIEMVKKHKAETGAVEGDASKKTETKIFKLHADQKETVEIAISKAKEQSGTEHDTVALEYICIDFMGGETLPKQLNYLTKEKLVAVLTNALKARDEETAAAIVKEVFEAVKHHIEFDVE